MSKHLLNSLKISIFAVRKIVLFLSLLSYCAAACLSAQVCPFNTIGRIKGEKRSIERSCVVSDSVVASMVDTVPRSMTYRLPMALPLKEISVSSPFGRRNDPIIRGTRRVHNGIDLRASFEPVYSMLPGVVTAASYSTAGGYYVTVDYGLFSCSFLHLSRIDVLDGQRVRAGQRIAVSGNSGRRTTGPHLHLSCKWSDTGKYFDPGVLLSEIKRNINENKKL